MKHITKVLAGDGWVLVRSVVTFLGVCLVILGVVMTLIGVSGAGKINVKTAVFEGELESGTVGLLFAFLGVLLLLCSLLKTFPNKLEVSRNADGAVTIKHKGALTKEKVRAIVTMVREGREAAEKERACDTDCDG